MHILLASNIIYHNLLWWIIYFYNSHSKDWREQGHPCCLEPVKLRLTCCGAGPPAISTHTPGCFDIYTLMWQNDCCIRKKGRERMIVVVGRGAAEQETIKCIGINDIFNWCRAFQWLMTTTTAAFHPDEQLTGPYCDYWRWVIKAAAFLLFLQWRKFICTSDLISPPLHQSRRGCSRTSAVLTHCIFTKPTFELLLQHSCTILEALGGWAV